MGSAPALGNAALKGRNSVVPLGKYSSTSMPPAVVRYATAVVPLELVALWGPSTMVVPSTVALSDEAFQGRGPELVLENW